MSIRINFKTGLVIDKPNKYVVILRREGGIIYRSGLIYLPDGEKPYMLDLPEGARVYEINHEEAITPQGDSPGPQYIWCPYCHTWEIWVEGGDDTYSCPICGISSIEFWVRTYNKGWLKKKGD